MSKSRFGTSPRRQLPRKVAPVRDTNSRGRQAERMLPPGQYPRGKRSHVIARMPAGAPESMQSDGSGVSFGRGRDARESALNFGPRRQERCTVRQRFRRTRLGCNQGARAPLPQIRGRTFTRDKFSGTRVHVPRCRSDSISRLGTPSGFMYMFRTLPGITYDGQLRDVIFC